MSAISVLPSQDIDSSSSGSSWDPQAKIPEQVRWASGFPGGCVALERAQRQIRDIGACEQPIWLRGRSLTIALATGEIVSEFTSSSSRDAPFGAVPIRCMNRRASRCRPCSKLYRDDAFHLAWAGMVGGKGVPASVSDNPRVFATFTAPSFGPVHRACKKGDTDDRCRVRRGRRRCVHGRALSCPARHDPGDKVVGSPLCPACYDYPGHVLFNVLASKLWKALTDTLYHRVAALGGVPRSEVRRLVRVEYVKVAEFQARGVVHFHVVLRLDGAGGAGERPPAWATAELLADAVRSAAAVVSVAAPSSAAVGDHVLKFGAQLDVQPIEAAGAVTDRKVSGYLAKYTTKSTEDAGGWGYQVTHASQIQGAGRTEHARALMWTAWRLGGLPEFEALNIRYWTHMLGYGGHPTTKSGRYSTTFGALRGARAAYRAGPGPQVPGGVVVDAEWTCAFSGYPSLSLRLYADQMREQLEYERQLARWALADERWERRGWGGDGP